MGQGLCERATAHRADPQLACAPVQLAGHAAPSHASPYAFRLPAADHTHHRVYGRLGGLGCPPRPPAVHRHEELRLVIALLVLQFLTAPALL